MNLVPSAGVWLIGAVVTFLQVAPLRSDEVAVPTESIVPPEAVMAEVVSGEGLPVELSAAAAAAQTNAPASPEAQRLQELLRLQFDRRPQSLVQTLARGLDPDPATTNAVQRFREDVVAGRWVAVGEFLDRLPEAHRMQVYRHVLQGLGRTPQPGMPSGMPGEMPPGMPVEAIQMIPPGMPPNLLPGPVLLVEDVLSLADLCPGEFTDDVVQPLGQLLSRALGRGNYIEPLLERLERGTRRLGGADPAAREQAVRLLVAANRLADAGRFLPQLETARTQNDLKALDLHARYQFELGRRQQNTNALAMAWELTQLLLASTNSPSTNAPVVSRDQLLRRALDLLPLIAKQQGTNWLRASFRDRPAQGMAILAAALEVQPGNLRDAEVRRKSLGQQHQAVRALLAVAGPEAQRWQTALNIVALNWVQEADMTRERWFAAPRQSPNPYGYYEPFNEMQRFQDPNQPQPIAPAALIELAPDAAWIEWLDATLAPRIWQLVALLYLKAEEGASALPYLEKLVVDYPKVTSELANELLRVWARTHNPNAGPDPMRMRYGPYGPVWFGPGSPYGQQGQGTSLTRATQVRNLRELAALLGHLRALPGVELDDSAVVGAFTAAHSQAEVFRGEDLERVFGPVERMKLETLAELLQTMRQRLASEWRQMRVQQEAKTRRNDKDIEAEILRGYELVTNLIDRGLARWPDHWRLRLVQAAAWFDWAEFQYGKKVDLAIYVEKRDRAFAAFQQAAALYAGQLEQIEPSSRTPLAYVQWFNANLGASDLAYVTRQQEPSTNQLALIRAALLALPGEAAEQHLARFGNELNESLNSIKPELKPRYVRAALDVLGDHPSGLEIRRLGLQYADLLQELALDVRIDGDALVGHTQPFGVFIGLRHSVEVERESGGFARYLQGQNNPYYFNPYGQQRSAREEFEKQLREKLNDGFEIKVITFADDKVQSRGFGRPGWRETPLAYLLVRAKDGAVDRIPSLHLDLDFVDRRGQVVLPVESAVVLLDARPTLGAPRPASRIAVTQVLDDRELAVGKLTLDLKATGRGVLPELPDLLEMSLTGLEVVKTNDSGVLIAKLDTEADELAAASERTWLLELAPAARDAFPAVFHFPKAKAPNVELAYKRYADADLVEVKPEVALAGVRLRPNLVWLWILLLAAAGGTVAWVVWRRQRQRAASAVTAPVYVVPEPLTPFTVLGLLRRLHGDPRLGWADNHRTELAGAIRELEQDYFAPPSNGAPDRDLAALARRWVENAKG